MTDSRTAPSSVTSSRRFRVIGSVALYESI
jgi:hypothetical protein